MEGLGTKEKIKYLLPTLWRLGPGNVATVAVYRMALKAGLFERVLPRGSRYDGRFFDPSPEWINQNPGAPTDREVVGEAESLLEGKVPFFSRKTIFAGAPPDWFRNHISGQSFVNPDRHWSKMSDFDQNVGDIKTVWEVSRFDWALIFARAFCVSGDQRFLTALNDWLADWTRNNPLNSGPNWKCGQETGIRLLQVLLVAYLLGCHDTPSSNLIRFVSEHCSRIAPTIRYAMAQDNNHGTSEAAALFVAGAWLIKISQTPSILRKARRWHLKGKRWLENRARRLIENDGSFSQYSLNYHRVLVDTLNIVEFWRRELGCGPLSPRFYDRSAKAVEWLYHLVDPETGDAPNLGSNDGARLFVLSSTAYRDYRPSVQLGAVLFGKGKVYGEGKWDEPLRWLRLANGNQNLRDVPRTSRLFPDGGYVLFRPEALQGQSTWGVLRYPRYRFRPNQCDGFHLDLWHGGVNILRDSGSYSYNTEEPWQSYFSSTAAHNSIQFDGRNQMPLLSRFLWGAWPRVTRSGGLEQDNDRIAWEGVCRDYRGASHRRRVELCPGKWKITDEIDGFETSAVLRWRLAPGSWQLFGNRCQGEAAQIQLQCSRKVRRLELVEGWESRYYWDKNLLPVLELQVDAGGKTIITTEIHLNS